MDGQYHNNEKIKESLKDWLLDVAKTSVSWQSNNLHINEVDMFNNVQREDWINVSFVLFDFFQKLKFKSVFKLFLHISLYDSNEEKDFPEVLSINWLKTILMNILLLVLIVQH